jgi:poly-gamma-glutamate synthesis protein (capsule biosynthesis protein)
LNDTTLSILIAGDMVPTKSNEEQFVKGDMSSLLGNSLYEIFQRADITSVNLECPLTSSETPIEKNGPNLRSLPETIKGIKALNPTIVGLANNHILDYGEKGLSDTLSLLSENGIPCVGVGNNLKEAAQSIHVVEEKGWRIGFYACAEHEFSIASAESPGANPFDALVTGDIIKSLKADHKLDVLIVLYHGGKEYYQYPSPGLQKVCRHLVEKGADLVVCQHSHCIGAYEYYQEGDIVYGQGNFIFDMKHPLSKQSLLLSYVLEKGESPHVSFIPIRCNDKNAGTFVMAEGDEKGLILEAFHARSEELKDPKIIKEKYKRFSDEMLYIYLIIASPFGKWFSRFDRYIFKGRLIKCLYSKKKLLALQNIIKCEAHRELFLKSINIEERNLYFTGT